MTDNEALKIIQDCLDGMKVTTEAENFSFWLKMSEIVQDRINTQWRTDEPPHNIPLIFQGQKGAYFIGYYDYTDKVKNKIFATEPGHVSKWATRWKYLEV